jgi:hypothetical protein
MLTTSRLQRNWRYVVAGVFSFMAVVLLAFYAFLRYKHRKPPLTRFELMHREADRQIDELYGPLVDIHTIPLLMLNSNGSNRALPSRVPTRDPIINRRQRPRNLRVNTSRTLVQPYSPTADGVWTPQRPSSARTTTSSIGRRTVASPLSSESRMLTPDEASRFFSNDPAEREAQMDILRTYSEYKLRRNQGH